MRLCVEDSHDLRLFIYRVDSVTGGGATVRQRPGLRGLPGQSGPLQLLRTVGHEFDLGGGDGVQVLQLREDHAGGGGLRSVGGHDSAYSSQSCGIDRTKDHVISNLCFRFMCSVFLSLLGVGIKMWQIRYI